MQWSNLVSSVPRLHLDWEVKVNRQVKAGFQRREMDFVSLSPQILLS